jgi:DNA-binding NarL/FixJ family response regulator
MTKKAVLTLIASNAGSLQNGIVALLTTIPQINAVLSADNLKHALSLAKEHQPKLTILEIAWPNIRDAITQFKTQCASTHLIVLVDDLSQQIEAEECGADMVLIKGFSPHQLTAILENLFNLEED